MGSTLGVSGVTTLGNNLVFSDIGTNTSREISFTGSTDGAFIRYAVAGANDGSLVIGTTDDGTEPINFTTSGNNRMRINGNGNVGIGTTSPAYTLDLNGNMRMPNQSTIFGNNAAGNAETFIHPRWSDNITYLNYGSGGFNIRNNSSTSTMFMTNAGEITMTKVFYPGMICGWYNNAGTSFGGIMYYITCSRRLIDPADVDDFWYVLPGYRFVLYDGENYTGAILGDFNNYSGTSVSRHQPSGFNRCTSVAVFYINNSNQISISGMSS